MIGGQQHSAVHNATPTIEYSWFLQVLTAGLAFLALKWTHCLGLVRINVHSPQERLQGTPEAHFPQSHAEKLNQQKFWRLSEKQKSVKYTPSPPPVSRVIIFQPMFSCG